MGAPASVLGASAPSGFAGETSSAPFPFLLSANLEVRDIKGTRVQARSTQITKITTVIRVKTSPARVPKALLPPMPPSAPAIPPPRPR